MVDDADGTVTKLAGDIHPNVAFGGSQLLLTMGTGSENAQSCHRWASNLQMKCVAAVTTGDTLTAKLEADAQFSGTLRTLDEIASDVGIHNGQYFPERHEVGVLDLAGHQFGIE
jgi:hypothetical protein